MGWNPLPTDQVPVVGRRSKQLSGVPRLPDVRSITSVFQYVKLKIKKNELMKYINLVCPRATWWSVEPLPIIKDGLRPEPCGRDLTRSQICEGLVSAYSEEAQGKPIHQLDCDKV